MALTTVNVTGTFNFPDATWTEFTQAEFMISGMDTDGEVIVPRVIKSTLGAAGELDVDLWGNDDGIRGTIYSVNIVLYSHAGLTREVKRIDLGQIQINGDGPLDIAALLNSPVTVPEVWYRTITEAEYDAAIAAVAAAESAAAAAELAEDGAQDAQSYAEEWAINPEDDPVSVAAGGDDSTTFSAYHWAAKAEEFASTINPTDYLQAINNLSDLDDPDESLDNLGITAAGKALLDDADSDTQLSTLGFGATGKLLAGVAALGTAGQVLAVNGAADDFEFVDQTGGSGGSLSAPNGRLSPTSDYWSNYYGQFRYSARLCSSGWRIRPDIRRF